ncbi:hypothetical protein MTR_3g498815 [Medicago truncatula]|uniref:Uncharacterized protein n=1 Tax=Medicago truncatula TaxID=3880 RepID=A0A072V1I0_MEDTR|nr:hypothetical protein MTR_3g498815 [Medicago truncatula]
MSWLKLPLFYAGSTYVMDTGTVSTYCGDKKRSARRVRVPLTSGSVISYGSRHPEQSYGSS